MIEQLAEMPTYEAYKDSGVEWLGEIPAHWKSQKLKFNAELRVSNVDKHSKKLELPVKLANYVDVYKNNFITDSIEFMEVTANQEEIERFSIKIDDVLITKDSEDWLDIGVPALVKYKEKNLLCGYHLAIIRSKSNAEGGFVFWALLAHYNRIQFSVKANGVTRFGISHGAIKNNWLALPPLPEQTAIASFLDRKTAQIDQAVAIKEQQIALFKERKQILIQNAVTRGFDPNVPMRDSGVEWIAQIPVHWEVTRLKYIFSETNERTKTGKEVLFSLRMVQGLIPHNDVSDKHIADENLIDYKIVRPGQMIMNRMRAAIGIFGLADKYGLVSPDYAVFDIGQNAFPEYFLRLFKTPLIGEQFRLNSKGLGTGSSGFMRLYTESFGDIKIPLPSREEQASIVTYIETQSAKIDQAISIQQQQIDKLKEYKATLINSAVTGKIKVPELFECKDVG